MGQYFSHQILTKVLNFLDWAPSKEVLLPESPNSSFNRWKAEKNFYGLLGQAGRLDFKNVFEKSEECIAILRMLARRLSILPHSKNTLESSIY